MVMGVARQGGARPSAEPSGQALAAGAMHYVANWKRFKAGLSPGVNVTNHR